VAWLSFGAGDPSAELAIVKANLDQIKAQLADVLQIVRTIMADVKIAQEDLDSTASALRALVTKLNDLDLTPLPAADQSALVSAVADVTNAVNRVTGSNTPDVPAPNPEPGPTETPTDDGSGTAGGDTPSTDGPLGSSKRHR